MRKNWIVRHHLGIGALSPTCTLPRDGLSLDPFDVDLRKSTRHGDYRGVIPGTFAETLAQPVCTVMRNTASHLAARVQGDNGHPGMIFKSDPKHITYLQVFDYGSLWGGNRRPNDKSITSDHGITT